MKQLSILLTFTLALALFVSPIQAVTERSESHQQQRQEIRLERRAVQVENQEARTAVREQQQEVRQASQADRVANRCELAKDRLGIRLENSARRHDAAMTRLERVETVVDSVITKLGSNGFDISDLSQALNEFKVEVDALNAYADTYQTALASVAAVDCEGDEVTFQAALTEAKTALETLKKQAQLVQDFFQSEIKPILQDLRTQAASLNVTE